MTVLYENISNLVEAQVPSFVREQHPKFVEFLKAYYKWLEDSEEGAVLYYIKNLISDIDGPLGFSDYYQRNFVKYVPPADETGTGTGDTGLDKDKLTKNIQDFYNKIGGTKANEFLFRILFKTYLDTYIPKEDILKASENTWTIPVAVRLTSNNITKAVDSTLLVGKRLTGESSKNFCVIENVYKTIEVDSGREILEVFVSNFNRPFNAGEFAIIDYKDAQGNSKRIREKIIGSILNLKINPDGVDVFNQDGFLLGQYKSMQAAKNKNAHPETSDCPTCNALLKQKLLDTKTIYHVYRTAVNRRGRNYRGLEIDPDTNAITYPGDPVVFYGGLSDAADAIKAEAYVKEVTSGGIQTVDLIDAGLGYRTFTNTFVTVLTPTEGHAANIFVRSVDVGNSVNVVVNTDTIEFKEDIELQAADFEFINVETSTINTTLGSAFKFANVNVAPLQVVSVRQSGMGYKTPPEIEFETFYGSDLIADDEVMQEIDITPLVGPNTRSLYLSTSPVTFYEGSYVLIVQKSSRATREMRKIVQAVLQTDGSVLLVVDRAFSALINENVRVYVENRPRMKDLGQIANVRIISGGTNYAVNDPILFNSSTSVGYGAAAHVSAVGGTGQITGITVTARGEGYYEAPNVSVQTTAGVNAILIAGVLSNNEIANTTVDGNGEIKSFRIVQRGFDYIRTPSVSLKVKDVYVKPTDTINKIIVPGERVWQNTGATTDFTALVDFYNTTTSMLRLYNYSGSLNVQNTFTTANTVSVSSNVTFNVAQYSNGTYKTITYGDGKARATVEFANGKIQYDGYFLNTKGFLSADKRLQGPRKYHNHSYVLASDVPLDSYKSTVLGLTHTTGASLFGQYNIDRELNVSAKETALNISIISPLIGTITANGASLNIQGTGTTFTTTANANDIIVIDTGNTYREQSKYIANVINGTTLKLESNLSFVGYGRANVKAGSNEITIYDTTVEPSTFLEVGDIIKVNVANTTNSANSMIVTREITVINDVTNKITCNATFIGVNSNGKIYVVSPFYTDVDYRIIPGD